MSGIWWGSASEERENEREEMAGNCRRNRGGEEGTGGRYEGGRDKARRQESDNKRGTAGDISSGQDGLKE